MTVPGGGEGTILPRLCSQPGERRPGPGAAHACSLSPARAPASRPPGLARHGVEGRRPGGSARSRVWKVWQEAEGRRYRGWPRWGPRVCAPGVESAPRRTETGRVEVSLPVPRARACPSPAAYNGVPSLRGLRGGWVRGHFSAERGFWAPLPATAPLAAELSVAAGAPGTLQLPSGPDQMLLPCVGLGQGRWALSPWSHVLVPLDPQRDRVLPGPLGQVALEGKLVGSGCVHQKWLRNEYE